MQKITLVILFIVTSLCAHGQFAGTLTRQGPPGSVSNEQGKSDDEDGKYRPPEYTIKRYFNSLAGKDSVNLSRLWIGSLILPGTAQIYNKDYWKLPVLYGGVAGFTYGGIHYHKLYKESGNQKDKRNSIILYGAAALTYWGGILDGVVSYKYPKEILPAKASIYSAMLPGLGQIYNGDYWKIPIIYGGFITVGYFISNNNNQYLYYKRMHNMATTPDSGYEGHLPAESLKYYRDTYRRFRDYSVLASVIVYALNVIDANVFAHLREFDMSDDITATISPSIMEIGDYKSNKNNLAMGLTLNIRF